ncbi:hypothetical protein ECC02_013583 [Trypanosoma cruzi]|uniref:Uncharacterized protein n=1 Tax=Trypanosoma cruzi TaxID=5693 RepID=A0A7J6XIT3_TRYCR|nr:hypothetical protein ECC02_013583 [Trypanosoma cruzi]
MTTNRCIHAAAPAPYERYMTTNRSIHAAAAAPYERYMTTNRGIHAAAAHPKHVAFVFQGTTQMCSIVRRSNLTPYVKMGRATTFFLAQWQNKLAISSGVRVRAPKKPKFFSFFFWNSCFLLLFKLLVCRTVCEFCNRDSGSVSWCAAAYSRWWRVRVVRKALHAAAHTLVFTHSLCVPCMDSRPHLIPRSTHVMCPLYILHAHPCRPVGALFCTARTAAVLPDCMGGAP